MLSSMQAKCTVRTARWAIILGAAGLLLLLFTPIAFAEQPSPVDPNTCALCHQSEVQDWRTSPHAGAMNALGHDFVTCQEATDPDCDCLTCHNTSFDEATPMPTTRGVTCEACHGPLVTGHPETGEMPLDVDSSVCSACHVETHAQWETTSHAQAGVQCIGCHRSHTQDLRLDDEVLCKSCHADRLKDSGHLAHAASGINCIDCHTSPAATVASLNGVMPSPSHDFSVAAETCQSCHGDTFHEDESGIMIAEGDWSTPLSNAPQVPAKAGAEDTSSLAASNRQWLQGATLLSFGLGIGVGGMLGIAFVLIAGFLLQRIGRG